MDELQIIHENTKRPSTKKLLSLFSPTSVDEISQKKNTTLIRFATPEADRTTLQAKTRLLQKQGHFICPVLYRNPVAITGKKSGRFLTNRLCIKVSKGISIQELLKAYTVKISKIVTLSPNTYILESTSEDILSSLNIANAIYESGTCDFSTPLIRRWRYPRFIPSDPLFHNQWHLKNDAQVPDSISGNDVEITSVWDLISGAGVNIAIVDDGLEYTHEDLACNARTDIDIDINFTDDDPFPDSTLDDHGTSVAGVAGACTNSTGGLGAAFNSGLVGIRLLADSNDDEQESQGLSHNVFPANIQDQIHFSNNSWGPEDDGKTLETFGPLTKLAFENAVSHGRGGRGTIFVWSAGNGRCKDDNINFDGYASSRYTIAVGASGGDGMFSHYSEPGASMLINAPSSYGACPSFVKTGITTTDLSGRIGSSFTSYTDDFGGTSSAAPLVSGIAALMLEANPNLGWRDVQNILIDTAENNDETDPDWKRNAAGRLFNPYYGFGRVNAALAVDQAINWINLPQNEMPLSANRVVSLSIPDNDSLGITDSLVATASPAFVTEHVEVVVDITHPRRGDLSIVLESPLGTKSELASTRDLDKGQDFSEWQFTSVTNWGENPNGSWKLTVVDNTPVISGTLNHWSLQIHGYFDETLRFSSTGNIVLHDSLENNNGSIDPGEGQMSLFLEIQNNGNNTTTNTTAVLHSSTPTVLISSKFSDYPDLPGETAAMNESPFIFSISPEHPCGAAIDLQLTITSSAGIHIVDFNLVTGKNLPPISFSYDSFSGIHPVRAIPDNDPQGIAIPLEVKGLAEVLTGLKFSFDGEQCNSLESANTNGINHPFVGDLIVTLISPNGTRADLINRLGFGSTGRDGNNFCQTIFDDTLGESPIQYINSTQAPFSGLFLPDEPLTVFTGENPNGTWTITLSDNAKNDEGNVRAFTLSVETAECESPPFDPPPSVSPIHIEVTGDDNKDGIFKIGDTIRIEWDNTNTGDNNNDINTVFIDFFGIQDQTAVPCHQ